METVHPSVCGAKLVLVETVKFHHGRVVVVVVASCGVEDEYTYCCLC